MAWTMDVSTMCAWALDFYSTDRAYNFTLLMTHIQIITTNLYNDQYLQRLIVNRIFMRGPVQRFDH